MCNSQNIASVRRQLKPALPLSSWTSHRMKTTNTLIIHGNALKSPKFWSGVPHYVTKPHYFTLERFKSRKLPSPHFFVQLQLLTLRYSHYLQSAWCYLQSFEVPQSNPKQIRYPKLAQAQVHQIHQAVLNSENHRVIKDGILIIGVQQRQEIFSYRNYEIAFLIYLSEFGGNTIQCGIKI
jgi:hypothetical protein